MVFIKLGLVGFSLSFLMLLLVIFSPSSGANDIKIPHVVMRPFHDPVQEAAEKKFHREFPPLQKKDDSPTSPPHYVIPFQDEQTDASGAIKFGAQIDPNITKTDKCQPGEPLMLTQYIDAGRVGEARAAARVTLPGFSSLISYAGYITVNRTDNSSTFFWFFVSEETKFPTPLVMWLQGGPGTSSMLGALVEHGPVSVDGLGRASAREFTWMRFANMLYVDNPLGTGYSYAGSLTSYVNSEAQIAQNMYEFLRQFYQLFPELLRSQFFLTGESYGGKYVPTLAVKIEQENEKNRQIETAENPLIIPLKGLAVGNGWISPELMLPEMAPTLFNMGLSDEINTNFVQNVTNNLVALIQAGRFVEASFNTTQMESIFYNLTGTSNFYNILLSRMPPAETLGFSRYMSSCPVRRAVHAGSLMFSNRSALVAEYLTGDMMRSTAPELVALSNAGKLRILLYNGQLDTVCGAAMTERMLAKLEGWNLSSQLQAAKKILWKLNPKDVEKAGYVRNVNNTFYAITVRGAGHLAPMDQPERVYDMMDRFLSNKDFAS